MKLTARTKIHANFYRLWHLTQTPAQHARWDLRFSQIDYLPETNPTDPQKFRYLTRLGFGVTIEGWGETVNTRESSPTSVLHFGSDDPKSLIREGTGCWIYRGDEEGVDFSTVYDYQVRYGFLGRLLDRLILRPLMIWATRWSFDRLRLWLEEELNPELTFRLWLLKIVARLSLALMWLITGATLIPTLKSVSTEELVFWGPVASFVLVPAVWVLSGKGEKTAAGTVSVMTILFTLMGLLPLTLVMCMGSLITILILERYTPKANRACFTPVKSFKTTDKGTKGEAEKCKTAN